MLLLIIKSVVLAVMVVVGLSFMIASIIVLVDGSFCMLDGALAVGYLAIVSSWVFNGEVREFL